MAENKKRDAVAYDRFASDDRATDAKTRGLMDIRPPRKNRKPLKPQKPTKKK